MLTNAARFVPPNIVESLRNVSDRPVFFLGSGFGKECCPPLKTGSEIAASVRQLLDISDNGEGLAEVLQYLQNARGRSKTKVVEWLKAELAYGSTRPGGAHHLLLRLPSREYVTTNYDTALLDASKRIDQLTLVPIGDPGSFDPAKHPSN